MDTPETQTYLASGFERQRQDLLKVYVFLSAVLVASYAGLGWVAGDFLAVGICGVVLLAALWGILFPYARRRINTRRESELQVGPSGVYVQHRGWREGLAWDEVRAMHVIRDRQGRVATVLVYAGAEPALIIHDHEQLDEAVEVMRSVAPPAVSVHDGPSEAAVGKWLCPRCGQPLPHGHAEAETGNTPDRGGV